MAGDRILCVDDPRDIDWGDVAGVRAICLPRASHDGHLAVICRIKGWELLDHDADAVVQPAPDPAALPRVPNRLQVSVFDPADVTNTLAGPVAEYFVRWEHLLYRSHHGSSATTGPALLAETVGLVHDLAAAARGRPLFLRLPDVRSDDPALAGLFFDEREPNPALGIHGTRYLLADAALRGAVAEAARDLPANVRLAAPYVTSSIAFFRLQRLLPDVPLLPFVETPMFLHDHLDYRDLDHVLIGLKDLTYLLRGLDREHPRIERPPRLFSTTVGYLRGPLTALTAGDGPAVSMSCTLEQLGGFLDLLHGVPWTPSLPAAQARVLVSR